MNYIPSILFVILALFIATKAIKRPRTKPTPWQRTESRRVMTKRRVDTSAGLAAVWCLNAQLKAQEQRRMFGNN